LIDTPLEVMANVGDCGVMGCLAVWLIGLFTLNDL
jgi:hypothetical protein